MNGETPENPAKGGSSQKTQQPEGSPVDIEIPPMKVEQLRWDTPENIQRSITALYQYAEANAINSIAWYRKYKLAKARMSRFLRVMAILFTTLGGLAPVLNGLGWNTFKVAGQALDVGQFGYLFLGLAAACIAFDRFFGFSTGWMRYIATKMNLERALSEFRLDWAMMVAKLGEKPPTPDQTQLMIQRLKEFLLLINDEVEKETETWISEFRTNLAEIEKSAKTHAEAARPGAIDITVTNGMETDDGFTVTLDGMEVNKVRGTRYQIGYVPPGPHKISITGSIGKQPLDASELVNVVPGEIANVTLALPLKVAQP